MPQFTFEEALTGWQANIKSGDPWKTSAVGHKNDTQQNIQNVTLYLLPDWLKQENDIQTDS